ncbi:MAG TPA: hypothetical protein TECP_00066 [Hyphomicrobiaceae bacterium MAG_BT-2024]
MHSRSKIYRNNVLRALAALSIYIAVLPIAVRSSTSFKDPYDAMQQGVSLYRSGDFQIAIPAFEYAIKHDIFPARYYLALIYSSNSSTTTNHSKAFHLFHKFVKDHADTDPADYRKAPTVGRAMTRFARYIRDGLPEIGLRADVVRAAEYFHHSATFFNDEDAQFELAKLQLTDDGVHQSKHYALYWFSVLAQKGHASAQAFLADLNWRGVYMKRNPTRALILIELAIENAAQEDRLWIEDIYQNIFCGAAEETKTKVGEMVAVWRAKFSRVIQQEQLDIPSLLNFEPKRTCADGRSVHQLSTRESILTNNTKTKDLQVIHQTNVHPKYDTIDGGYHNSNEQTLSE